MNGRDASSFPILVLIVCVAWIVAILRRAPADLARMRVGEAPAETQVTWFLWGTLVVPLGGVVFSIVALASIWR